MDDKWMKAFFCWVPVPGQGKPPATHVGGTFTLMNEASYVTKLSPKNVRFEIREPDLV
jgi:hypothetical protein